MYSWVKEGGVYCVEDTHTSYWGKWGGEYHKPGTFLELVKELIDVIHLTHHGHPLNVNNAEESQILSRTIRSMTIADSIVCFEKGKVIPWGRMYSGDYAIPY